MKQKQREGENFPMYDYIRIACVPLNFITGIK